jgi:hypothetical protein
MIGRSKRSIYLHTRASVAFKPTDPSFTRIGQLADTRVVERPLVLWLIPNIFHYQSTSQIGWHALLQTRESRVSRARVTSYFFINTLLAHVVGHEKVNDGEA